MEDEKKGRKFECKNLPQRFDRFEWWAGGSYTPRVGKGICKLFFKLSINDVKVNINVL